MNLPSNSGMSATFSADFHVPAAVVWDNGEHDPAREVLYRLKERLDNMGYVLGSLADGLESPEKIEELATETRDEDDEDDGMEPYCTTCGQWASIFIGHGDGWHHFRGEGTSASPVELYDAGHEVTAGWTVPAGRTLAPADIGIIRQALADAGAMLAYKVARNRCDGAADRELALAYQRLSGRLAAADVAGQAEADGGAE